MAKGTKLQMAGLMTKRERLWAAARSLNKPAGFTLLELQDATRPVVNMATADRYKIALVAAGYLENLEPKRKGGKDPFAQARYRIVKDTLEAPRLDANGRRITAGDVSLAMWRAMQVLKEFDFHDVHRAANLAPTPTHPGLAVAMRTAKGYVHSLAQAGYFQVLKPAKNVIGKGATPARYRLLRNTGAHAPIITSRRVVFDRNVGEFPLQQTAQEVCDGIDA